jgi:tetratricopeptide (TPR) repeat protein
LGRYDEAIEYLKQVNKLRIDKITLLAGSYTQLGQMDKAGTVIEEVLRKRPDYSLEKFSQSLQFRRPEDATRWLEEPRKAGLPEKSLGKGS